MPLATIQWSPENYAKGVPWPNSVLLVRHRLIQIEIGIEIEIGPQIHPDPDGDFDFDFDEIRLAINSGSVDNPGFRR